jgi:hypothetical protein
VIKLSFINDVLPSSNERRPFREALASLRGRRYGRHVMGSEG